MFRYKKVIGCGLHARREHKIPWGAQAAAAGIWASFAAMAGYHFLNVSGRVPSRVWVRVCRSKWAPALDHCICCFLAKRLPTTRLTVDSVKAVEIGSA